MGIHGKITRAQSRGPGGTSPRFPPVSISPVGPPGKGPHPVASSPLARCFPRNPRSRRNTPAPPNRKPGASKETRSTVGCLSSWWEGRFSGRTCPMLRRVAGGPDPLGRAQAGVEGKLPSQRNPREAAHSPGTRVSGQPWGDPHPMVRSRPWILCPCRRRWDNAWLPVLLDTKLCCLGDVGFGRDAVAGLLFLQGSPSSLLLLKIKLSTAFPSPVTFPPQPGILMNCDREEETGRVGGVA